MRIGIIGGGLTGLVAANVLAGEHDIHLFEKMPFLGGCLASYSIKEYQVERYYHHCFSTDNHLFSLLKDLGLFTNLEWKNGTTGYYSGNKIYPLTTPLQILKYPELSVIDKAKLAWLTLTAKKTDLSALDDISAEQYIIDKLGGNVYTSFFEPLLKSKFGERRKDVSAAWLLSRIAIRSNRGVSGENLGYLKGGFSKLIETLENSIERKGGTICKQTPVASVSHRENIWTVNGDLFDAVISTIPPQEFQKIGGPVVPQIPYQGAACMTLGMDREVSEGIYWLNMKDNTPYGAVVTHTNFITDGRYGEQIIYLASYFSGKVPARLDKIMLDDFCSRFSVSSGEISWQRMAVDPFAGPVYSTGYKALIPTYMQKGFYMAGMFSQPNYPERSMEGSIRAGMEVANCVAQRSSYERN
jgi:protoporphyrinogen oxidase